MTLEDLKLYLDSQLVNRIESACVSSGELTLVTTPANILNLLYFLRDNQACLFSQLIDLCGVDYPHRQARFDVVYHLLSLQKNKRIRVKVPLEEGQSIPSCAVVFKAAGWWEREAWDMFGIPFSDHPDLRRILTDYGFDGFPLRKDFPLTGTYEVRYDHERGEVIREPVSLMQAYRSFDFETPWEGTQTVLTDSVAGGVKND